MVNLYVLMKNRELAFGVYFVPSLAKQFTWVISVNLDNPIIVVIPFILQMKKWTKGEAVTAQAWALAAWI